MKISANQLSANLTRKLSPCYLVSGDETLLVQETLDLIRASAKSAGYLSRDLHIATTGFDWAEFLASGGNLSLFADRRVIELQLPTGKPGRPGGQAIVDMIARTGDDLMLIVSAPKLDKSTLSTAWAKALDAAGVLVQVWPVDQRELPGWLSSRMKTAGLQPDRDAVRLIAERVEGNLLAAQQEIEKLRLLHGEGPISAQDVEDAVADSSRFDVYKLVDAAVAGDAGRAIRILAGVRGEGLDAVIVVWALTRELRVLAALAENVRDGTDLGAAMQKARIWQNRQGMVRACISRHSVGGLYALLQLLRRADAAAKGQSGDDPWQLANEIIITLAARRLRAA